MYYKIKRVYDWFRYDLPYGIENLIKWFPTIWKDRNWDYYFIYVILRYKLKLTEKTIRNGHHVDCEKDADKIKKCIFLLNRLIKDDYLEMTMKVHDKKWGKGTSKFEKIKDSEFYSWHIDYENVKTEKDKIQQRKDFKRAIERENILKKQDKKMLFKLLEKHIETWWD